MGPKASNTTLIIFLMVLATSTSISGVNITYFLNQYPEFSTFNSLLTQSKVADRINLEQTVTVLVLDNSAVASITGNHDTTLMNILATHVLLDFYDVIKLNNLDAKSSNATNLFQTTGKTSGKQGLTHITKKGNDVIFSCAENGAPQDSKMVKVVNSKASTFSAIQISTPIVTPGLDQVKGNPGSPMATPATPPPPPPPPKKDDAPAPEPEEDNGDGAEPSDEESPSAAPGSGPSPDVAPEAEVADSETPAKMAKNGGARLSAGGLVGAALMGLVALLAH